MLKKDDSNDSQDYTENKEKDKNNEKQSKNKSINDKKSEKKSKNISINGKGSEKQSKNKSINEKNSEKQSKNKSINGKNSEKQSKNISSNGNKEESIKEDEKEENKEKKREGDEEEEEEEEELDPPRPELEEIEKQTIRLLNPSEDGPNHPRTIFFYNDPELNSNKKSQGLDIVEYEIKQKKFMVLYKAYKNLPQSLSGPMKHNQIVRSKLYSNTNLIWKLLEQEKMYPLFKKLNKYQRFNHFPSTWQLCRKDNLYTNYVKMQKRFPEEYNFMPETFTLPRERELVEEKLKEYNVFDRQNLYIIKPVASSRGRGVRVLTDVTTLPQKGMVQRYIYNPHLINKKKYDIRLYLLVTGFCPLKVYLYENGIVRFCSEDFDIDPEKLNNNYVHVTNFSVNKAMQKIRKGEGDEELPTKWSLIALKGYFTEKKIDFKPVWTKIKDIMMKLILSVVDIAIPSVKQFKLTSNNLFELYGVDIILDNKLNPWLLECNLNPSLNCDTETDLRLKSKLLTDIFNIIGLVPYSHDGQNKTIDKENYYQTCIEEAVTESLCEFVRPSGGFERLFPLKENIDIFSKYISKPGEENKALWEEMKKD